MVSLIRHPSTPVQAGCLAYLVAVSAGADHPRWSHQLLPRAVPLPRPALSGSRSAMYRMLAAAASRGAEAPGPGSLWVLAVVTSPWQCGQVRTGRVTLPQVS